MLYSSVRSDSSGGIGLIFRFQDVDNFYYALLHDNGNPAAPFHFRIIGRKQAGTFSFLERGGADDTAGYTPNSWFTLRLAVQDEQFELAINVKTAAALGLVLPHALLATADRVLR